MDLLVRSEVKLDSPTLIAALPDMGNVAGLAMNHLMKVLKPELVAEIHGDYPPYVVHHAGYANFTRSTYKIHADEAKGLLTFSGDAQPSSSSKLYELCGRLLDYADKMRVKRVFSLGGAYAEDVKDESRVFGVVNKKELLGELKERQVLELQGDGRITGFNGLVLGLAHERGIDGICLLGEIDNPNIKQPGTASRVLQTLGRLLGLELDVTDLMEQEKKIKEHLKAEHARGEMERKTEAERLPRYVS